MFWDFLRSDIFANHFLNVIILKTKMSIAIEYRYIFSYYVLMCSAAPDLVSKPVSKISYL